jgi:hypothetical protein
VREFGSVLAMASSEQMPNALRVASSITNSEEGSFKNVRQFKLLVSEYHEGTGMYMQRGQAGNKKRQRSG